MTLSPKAHRIAVFVAQILLPSLGTLYFALAGIWNLPAAEQIIGTIIAVDTFLGVTLGVAVKVPTDGAINVVETPEKLTYSMELHDDPATLKDKSHVTFKVNQNPVSQEKPVV